MAKQNGAKVVTGVVRLSYANVWQPKSINGGAEKYSCSIIIPKEDKATIDAINAAIDAAIKEGAHKFGGKVPPRGALKLPLRDGDTEREDEAYIAKGDFVFAEKDVISLIASPKNAADFFKKIAYRTHSVKDALIVGGGQITHYLCEMLREDGVAVKVIDRKPEVCLDLTTRYPHVTVIQADGGNQETLLEEGVETAGAFLTLTNHDEENILLSLLAKRLTKGKLVTKINRFDFSDVVAHLDLDSIIYPKNVASDVIVRYVRAMKNTIGSNVETLYNIILDKIEASEFIVKEGAPVCGQPLSALQLQPDMLIASILREDKVIIPRGHNTIEPGDRVVIVSREALHDISDVLR